MSVRWRKNRTGSKTAFIDITIPGFERIRSCTGIRSDQPEAKARAQEYHDRKTASLWRQAKYKERPRRTWDEAVVQWLKEHPHKKSLAKDIEHLRWLDHYLGGKWLDEIDRDMVETAMLDKEAEGRAPSTINRYAAVARSILRTACMEWSWIAKAPHIRMRQEAGGRIRWLTRDEVDMLLGELAVTAPHVADAVSFTLATGLREQNVARLRWDQINFSKLALYVYATKNGEALGTPLNSDAMAVLMRRKDIHATHVFSYAGRPVARFNNSAWRKAIGRAGIRDMHWHDLRHTWASWMVQAGCPLEVLQKLGGWKKMDMVLRYAHFSTDSLAGYAELSARDRPLLRAVK